VVERVEQQLSASQLTMDGAVKHANVSPFHEIVARALAIADSAVAVCQPKLH